jgi:hypothetical protein
MVILLTISKYLMLATSSLEHSVFSSYCLTNCSLFVCGCYFLAEVNNNKCNCFTIASLYILKHAVSVVHHCSFCVVQHD